MYNIITELKKERQKPRKDREMEVNVRSNKKKPPTLITGDSYIKIYGFMRSAMQLEKTELLVYALIYSYFRNSAPFTGSREYIAEWVGSGKSSVDIALKSLLEKGYISKAQRYERGYTYIEYGINVAALPPSDAHYNMIRLCREDVEKCKKNVSYYLLNTIKTGGYVHFIPVVARSVCHVYTE